MLHRKAQGPVQRECDGEKLETELREVILRRLEHNYRHMCYGPLLHEPGIAQYTLILIRAPTRDC
jgi:hypothetical protein